MENCIFCKIVKGKIPCYKIWENQTHMAFLSIFPNIKGFSVVIPKKHLPSKVSALEKEDYIALLLAAKEVSLLLDKTLNVERTAIIAEGMGINHAHIKLFPLIGTTPNEEWNTQSSTINTYFTEYRGYVSSHDSTQANDKELAELAKHIKKVNKYDRRI